MYEAVLHTILAENDTNKILGMKAYKKDCMYLCGVDLFG